MKHYCRYCLHCIGQDGGVGYCEQKNETIQKTSIRDTYTDFDFCEIDAFYFDRSDNLEDAKYRPRQQKNKEYDGQLSFFMC